MDQRVWLIGVLFLVACSGSAAIAGGPRGASSAAPERASASDVPDAPVARAAHEAEPARSAEPPRPPLDSDADNDQAYLENTERAVELYREFIERAGTDPQYAAAVKRSREQIEDLTNAGRFVGEGMRERVKK